MSEPFTFGTVSRAIRLARYVNAAPRDWKHTKPIVDFIDALMIHMEWPDNLWDLKTPVPSDYDAVIGGFLSVVLVLKTHEKDTPALATLTFASNANKQVDLLGYDKRSVAASFPMSAGRSEYGSDSLNNASNVVFDAATKATSRL